MIRVLQNLPQRLFKSSHGGVYWANRGQPVAESQRRKHQDKLVWVPYAARVLDARFHTRSKCEKVGYQERSDEEWKRSFKQRIEWDSFKSSHCVTEAVGWGSIIVLGLQLGRFVSKGYPSDEQQKHECLLTSLARALPCPYRQISPRRSILPEEETSLKRNNEATPSLSSEEESLYQCDESPLWDFKLTDDQPSRFFKPSASPSPSSSSFSSSSSISSRTPSFSDTTADPLFPSSTPSRTGFPSNEESKVPFDLVTRQCMGRVNNIIGGHLMSEGEEEKAVHHFMVASESGYSKGQYNLGMCYERGKGVLQDDVKAAVFFGLAAEQGHPQAQYKLGTYHLVGKGNVKQCEHTGLTLISKAADGGVVQAQSYLGMFYMTIEEPDPDRSVAYLQLAANKKDVEAQYHLGLCYEYGWGIEMNHAKASSLYHAAASKDHAPSLYSLALFHEQGLGGLPENPSYAKELLTKASSMGYEKATEKLLEMDLAERNLKSGPSSRSSSTSTLSTDSTSWTTTTGSESESTEYGQSVATSWSSGSLDSDISVHFDAGAPLRLDWTDVLPPDIKSMHVSISAPELTPPKGSRPMIDISGDVNSLLHSLSCLAVSTLHQKVKGQSDGHQWTHSPQRLTGGLIGGQESKPRRSEKVVFQLGGLEEDDHVDWFEPISVAGKMDYFKRTTAVI